MNKQVSIESKASYKIPMLPNYIQRDGTYRHVGDISKKDLVAIAQEWSLALIARGKEDES